MYGEVCLDFIKSGYNLRAYVPELKHHDKEGGFTKKRV